VYVVCRASTSLTSIYGLDFNGSQITPFKVVNGTYSTIGSSVAQSYSAGMTLRLEVSGTTLTFKVNGATVTTRTDTSLASGRVGVGCDSSTGRVDNWSGGNLGAVVHTGVASLTGAGVLTSVAFVKAFGVGSLTGAGTLSGTGKR
jgi:hypothetical protein